MKFPTINHLPWSQEIHREDKKFNAQLLYRFQENKVIITEKLDGGNACLSKDAVFARSHSAPADHPSFDHLKRLHASIRELIPKNTLIFGENMYAVHSIVYEKLSHYFYIFAMYDIEGKHWYNWRAIEGIAKIFGIPTVPVIYKGLTSLKTLESWMIKNITAPSFLGREMEGFVIRTYDMFYDHEFPQSVAKFVRKGHIQSDEHWKRNYVKQNLQGCFTGNSTEDISRLY